MGSNVVRTFFFFFIFICVREWRSLTRARGVWPKVGHVVTSRKTKMAAACTAWERERGRKRENYHKSLGLLFRWSIRLFMCVCYSYFGGCGFVCKKHMWALISNFISIFLCEACPLIPLFLFSQKLYFGAKNWGISWIFPHFWLNGTFFIQAFGSENII